MVNVPRPRRLDDRDHSSSICTKSGAATEAHIGARLGAAPGEMLFADDSANNVAGAERVALGGHVYVDADTLAEITRVGRIAGMERIAAVDDRRTAIERRPELSTPGARRAVRPLDDPARPKFGRKVAFAGRDPATHGDAGLVHAVGRTRNE